MNARSVAAVALSLACAGCASWSPETRIEESAYQVLNAVDAGQTLTIARDPDHFHEIASADLIGRHPSERSVAALFVAQAALHAGVTEALEAGGAPAWAVRLWQGATIAVEAKDIAGNTRIGIRFCSGGERRP